MKKVIRHKKVYRKTESKNFNRNFKKSIIYQYIHVQDQEHGKNTDQSRIDEEIKKTIKPTELTEKHTGIQNLMIKKNIQKRFNSTTSFTNWP